MISICPFNDEPCRGPECPMLVSYECADGGFRFKLRYPGGRHGLGDYPSQSEQGEGGAAQCLTLWPRCG